MSGNINYNLIIADDKNCHKIKHTTTEIVYTAMPVTVTTLYTFNKKSSKVAEMGDRGHNRHRKKWGWDVPPPLFFWGGVPI